jgi:hypothetical protein
MTTVTPGRRRSLAVGAAVLAAAAVIGGAGGAGAAGLLTGRNVRDDSLRSADIRDGSIGAARVRDGGLSQSDVGFDLTGDQGLPGDTGAPGNPGIRAITVRSGPAQSTATAATFDVVAFCDSGEIALSGGASLTASALATRHFIEWSALRDNNGWFTRITTTGASTYTPWVVCAQVS